MDRIIQNIEGQQVFKMKEMVSYEKGQVVSMTLANLDQVKLTLFAFSQGEGISSHAAPGDAMVEILEGKAEITVDGKAYSLSEGESLIMPKGLPHALKAVTDYKMLLTLVKA